MFSNASRKIRDGNKRSLECRTQIPRQWIDLSDAEGPVDRRFAQFNMGDTYFGKGYEAFVNNGSGSLSRTLVFRHSGRGARPFDRRQLRRRQSGLLPSETGRGFQSARRIDHPEIGAVSQELVDEVAVRSVKLNAIDPSVYRIESSPPEILHDVSDLIQR